MKKTRKMINNSETQKFGGVLTKPMEGGCGYLVTAP